MFVFDPYSREVDANPYPLYQKLRDEHPCYWSEPGNCWVLSRHDDIVAAVQNWQVFSSARGNLLDDIPARAGSTLGTTDPPRHDRLRNLVQAAFATRNIEYLSEPTRALAHRAIDAFHAQRQFDFITGFSSPITVGVLSHLLGIPAQEHRAIRENVVLILQTDPVTRQKPARSMQAFDWLLAYIDRMLAEREREPTDDLLTALLQAEIDGDKLQPAEIRMTSLTLVMAGVESASSFMAMLAMNLHDHPEARTRLIANPSLMPAALEESLRYNSSAQRFKRNLTRDYEIHGQQLRSGDHVLVCYGSANRDERRWDRADQYDIDRNPRGHLGMGTGKHMCLGAAIGRLIVRSAINVLLERIPDYQQASGAIDWIPSTTFRAPQSYQLRF